MAWAHRKHRTASGPRTAAKYGTRRLETLYEISKLFTRYSETTELIIPPLLAIITKDLPLQSVILVDSRVGEPKVVAWHSPDQGPTNLRAAEARAMASFASLSGSSAPAAEVVEKEAEVLRPPPAGGPTASGLAQGRFVTCPLIIAGQPIFGALHMEGVVPFIEEDIAFLSAIANQFAIALDRDQARLREVALRRQAEQLSTFKTNLVSLVSHEFGNALSVMKTAAFLLKERLPIEAPQESERLIEMILAHIDDLTGAVQNLLGMGRREAGKLAIDFRAVDLSDILTKALKSLELLYEKKRLQVSIELPAYLEPARADKDSLTLVVSNLLSNAIKYTPEGGRIALGVSRESARPGFFRIYVQDTGIGVSEEERAKILGGHYRSESGKSMTAKGYGIGLSLAQQIVEAHGSTIEIEGGPGKGSRFSFVLPIFSGRA